MSDMSAKAGYSTRGEINLVDPDGYKIEIARKIGARIAGKENPRKAGRAS
jgi:hypothetical protein